MALQRKKNRPGPFLGPNGSFPVGDKKHQRLAISGAARSYHAGNISKAKELEIQSRARAMLKK